jgi:hypothetical protein
MSAPTPGASQWAKGQVFTADSGAVLGTSTYTLSWIRPSPPELLGSFAMDHSPQGVEALPGGNWVFVAINHYAAASGMAGYFVDVIDNRVP